MAAVLASAAFRRSPKLSRLLEYLCEKQFEGRAAEITEYGIAFEVLGRSAQFDPQQDAIVRVDSHHLRKKLKEYYAGAGADHPIQIVIPVGHYAPQFVPRGGATAPVEPNWGAARELKAKERKPPAGKSVAARWQFFAAALILAALAAPWALPRIRPAISSWMAVEAGSGRRDRTFAPAQSETAEIRIAAGARTEGYVDTAGRVWLADRYFAGGTTFHRAALQIQRTQDPDLFQNGREGQFSYAIPLPRGVYELHLYFAETGVASDTLRTVNIAVNGQAPSNFDIASDAGGANTATVKIFNNISPAQDGLLHLAFQGGPNFVNAIEILPGIPGKIRPIRITMRDSAFTDHLGQVWLPDQWVAGGRKSTRIVSIGGTADAGLYQWERFGHFSYSIPVAEGGLYTVILHFSETWFTPANSLGGLGSRVFDVYCNGTTLLKGFDILKEAGGVANQAVVRVFHHVPASPIGKVELTFVPIANYALINAIEVIGE
jgi:hypothetical protein